MNGWMCEWVNEWSDFGNVCNGFGVLCLDEYRGGSIMGEEIQTFIHWCESDTSFPRANSLDGIS